LYKLEPRIVIFKEITGEKEKSEAETGIKKPGRPGKKSTMK
jgi:hypothetical protein